MAATAQQRPDVELELELEDDLLGPLPIAKLEVRCVMGGCTKNTRVSCLTPTCDVGIGHLRRRREEVGGGRLPHGGVDCVHPKEGVTRD